KAMLVVSLKGFGLFAGVARASGQSTLQAMADKDGRDHDDVGCSPDPRDGRLPPGLPAVMGRSPGRQTT
ncbi:MULTISPECIES: hypothetical protein, partial [unclassified Mesorhizobium]|uniref:hypothetical protein n=1 Tax=unclassified Mesorhizobium TaxID=325217 RepID=UPI000BDC0A69